MFNIKEMIFKQKTTKENTKMKTKQRHYLRWESLERANV